MASTDSIEINRPTIESIISGAESKIFNLTGCTVRLVLKEEKEYNGVDKVIKNVAVEMCEIWDCDVNKLYLKTRKREIVAMRSIVMHYVRIKYPSFSLVQIGKHFALDHTSVIHNISKVKDYIGANDFLFNIYYKPIKHLYEPTKIQD